MKSYKIIFFVCVAYWITRLIGLNYFVEYQSLDFVATLVTGVSLIGMLWIVGGKGWGIALSILFLPVFLLGWLFSYNYRPLDDESGNTKYFITEDADYITLGDEYLNHPDKYQATYKPYEKVIGPIYLKKKVFRERMNYFGNGEAEPLERILNDSN